MRAVTIGLAGAFALTISACSEDAPLVEVEEALPSSGEEEESSGVTAQGVVEGATPLEERVATIGLLNKRNNLSQDIQMRPGEVREEGAVILRLATCERTAPWEMPQETGAFVQLDVLERGASEHTRVFSGWLFKDSPSLNVVEHPIYDVWIKDCAMRFPGENAAEDSDET